MGLFQRSNSNSSSSDEERQEAKKQEQEAAAAGAGGHGHGLPHEVCHEDATRRDLATLSPGEKLVSDCKGQNRDKLVGKTGEFEAVMQPDGNFVVYTSNGAVVWATNTTSPGEDGPFSLAMEPGGKVAVTNSREKVLWSAEGEPGSHFALKGKHLVIEAGGDEAWSSKDYPHDE